MKKPDFINDGTLDFYKDRKCVLGGLMHNRLQNSKESPAISVKTLTDIKNLGLDYVIDSTIDFNPAINNFANVLTTLTNANEVGIKVKTHHYLIHTDWDGRLWYTINIDKLNTLLEYPAFEGFWIDEPGMGYYTIEEVNSYNSQLEGAVHKNDPIPGTDRFYTEEEANLYNSTLNGAVTVNDINESSDIVRTVGGIKKYYSILKSYIHNHHLHRNDIILDINLLGTHASNLNFIEHESGNYTFNLNNNYARYVKLFSDNCDAIGADIYPVHYDADINNIYYEDPGNPTKPIRYNIGKYKYDDDGNILYLIDSRNDKIKSWAISMNCLLHNFHNNPLKIYTFFISTTNLYFTVKKKYTDSNGTQQYETVSGRSVCLLKGTDINGNEIVTDDANLNELLRSNLTIEDMYVNLWDTLPKLTYEMLSLQTYCALICGASDIRYFCLADSGMVSEYNKQKYNSSPFKSDLENFEPNTETYNIIKQFNTESKFKYLKDFITSKYIYGVDISYKNSYNPNGGLVCSKITGDENINNIENLVGEFILIDNNSDDKFMVSIGFDEKASYCFIVNLELHKNITINLNNQDNNIFEIFVNDYGKFYVNGLKQEVTINPGDICILKKYYENTLERDFLLKFLDKENVINISITV